jgi:tetratricopeptide (TPR) repeat protein
LAWQISEGDRAKYARTVWRAFGAEGWRRLERPKDERIIFEAIKDDIRMMVSYVDGAQLRFLSEISMIERMDGETRMLKSRDTSTIVYIMNFHFRDHSIDDLAQRGISLFHESELAILINLARYQHELPPPLSRREMLVFEANQKLCSNIADRFYKIGDRKSAVTWWVAAIALKRGFSRAYLKLIDLHIEDNDLDRAQEIGLMALDLAPQNAEYLVALEQLAILRGDSKGAAEYREKAAKYWPRPAAGKEAKMPARTLDEILRRQAQVRTAPQTSADDAFVGSEKPKDGHLKQLLNRLRGH